MSDWLALYLRGCVIAPIPMLSHERRGQAAWYGGMALAAIVQENGECAYLAARCAWREAAIYDRQQRSVWSESGWRGVWMEGQ
jgi:hypothetical protein